MLKSLILQWRLLVAGFVLLSQISYAQLPNDVKWVTSSVEYAAACLQAYRCAWRAVQEMSQSETSNWVVVLDVDETVLDNSQYQQERAEIDSSFTPQSWAKWVHRIEAGLVPGAKTFIDSVRTLGPKAHIAYITNRDYEHEAATVANLKKFDLFKDRDIILTRRSPEDSKLERRRCLETGTGRCERLGALKIIALVGDNIRDFIPMRGETQAAEYRETGLFLDPEWGLKYFVLPNPMYGSWQREYR